MFWGVLVYIYKQELGLLSTSNVDQDLTPLREMCNASLSRPHHLSVRISVGGVWLLSLRHWRMSYYEEVSA